MKTYENTTKIVMGRLPFAGDLLEELNGICRTHNITLGRVEALGAVSQARLGFYHQSDKTYQFLTFDEPMEITNLVGNISLKDGLPFVHAHVTLSDHQGRAWGGHLAPGTTIFACEAIIQPFLGTPLNRGLDQQTGLPLWVDV